MGIKAKPTSRQLNRLNLIRKILYYKQLYFMILPGFTAVLLFSFIPIYGWIMAFTDFRIGKSMWSAPWVGLKYFKEFFINSSEAMRVIINTLVMNISSMVLGILLAMIFAVLLKELRRPGYKKFIQSVTFFPYFMSWVILYAVVYSLFSTSSGAINELLMNLGLLSKPVNILGDPRYSWQLIITVNIWSSLGYSSVIFIAAIAGIPIEQYESAKIDGANRFHEIWHITVPNLIPTVTVLFIMNSGWLFNSGLDQYFIFTNTLNMPTMEVFDYYIYRFGLKIGNYSYATAVGIVKTFVSIVLLVAVNQISKKTAKRSIF